LYGYVNTGTVAGGMQKMNAKKSPRPRGIYPLEINRERRPLDGEIAVFVTQKQVFYHSSEKFTEK
jgi:hypothetical protein